MWGGGYRHRGGLGGQTTWDRNRPLTYRSVTLSKSPALSVPWGRRACRVLSRRADTCKAFRTGLAADQRYNRGRREAGSTSGAAEPPGGCVSRGPQRAGRGRAVTQRGGSPEPALVLLSLGPPLFLPPQAEVDTEYSDPFDAQPPPPPPDDGYMEPYDAQRVASGERAGPAGGRQGPRRERVLLTSLSGPPELPCKAVQLYDTPYDEREEEPGDGPPSGQRPPPSRLPREDERPADEYDQPWEWKKDHISKAFAGASPTPASSSECPNPSVSYPGHVSCFSSQSRDTPIIHHSGSLLIFTKVCMTESHEFLFPGEAVSFSETETPFRGQWSLLDLLRIVQGKALGSDEAWGFVTYLAKSLSLPESRFSCL